MGPQNAEDVSGIMAKIAARAVSNRDAEWQWLVSGAFLVFDSEMG